MKVFREGTTLILAIAVLSAIGAGAVQLIANGSNWAALLVIQAVILLVAAAALVATASWRGHKKSQVPETSWMDWFRHL